MSPPIYNEMSDASIEHTLSLGGAPVLMHIAYRQLKASEAILAALEDIRSRLERADHEVTGEVTGSDGGRV